MILKHTNHTAYEFLKATGEDHFHVGEAEFYLDEIFGKVLIRIGGVVVDGADHLIGVGDADSVEIIVGNVRYEVPVEDSDESQTILTDEAKKAVEKKAEKTAIKNSRLHSVKEFMEILRKDPEATFTADEGNQADLDELVAEAKKQLEYENLRLEAEAEE